MSTTRSTYDDDLTDFRNMLYHGLLESGGNTYIIKKAKAVTHWGIMKMVDADPDDVTYAFGITTANPDTFATALADPTILTYAAAPDS